jgi:branched-chain amino acid aminotransferase
MARRTETGIEFYPDDFFLYAVPFGDYLDVNKPISCGVCSWQRIDDNMIPARAKATGLYINSALARTEAEENGYDEAIMLTAAGHVSEGSGENLFIVRDGKLITPSHSENILEGITRATVIQLARDEMGLETVERSIDRTELYIADELFLCGTGAQISAVSQVDHRTVGSGEIGPITAELMKLYFDVVKGRHPKYADWCTGVYPASVNAAVRQT